MKIIVCVDKSNGMMFNNRRQSQDSVLREKVISLLDGKKLFLNEYSAQQFENTDCLCISDDFLQLAGTDDFCFIETDDIPSDKADEIYLLLQCSTRCNN